MDEELKCYNPHNTFYPRKQTALLQLFDEIGIPHEKKKQEFGWNLTIIGLHVSLDSMTITMPDKKRDNLVKEVLQSIIEKSQ